MNIYTNLTQIFRHLKSIRHIKGYISFDLSFPQSWQLVEPPNQANFEIITSNSPDNFNVSFVCKFDESSVITAFDFIVRTIKFNEDKELKNELFKDFVGQLKDLFISADINDLTNITKAIKSQINGQKSVYSPNRDGTSEE